MVCGLFFEFFRNDLPFQPIRNMTYLTDNKPSSGGNDTSSGDKAQSNGFAQNQAPQLNLPKGGGAIRQIDQKFNVNAVNGTAGGGLSLPFSASRNDFVPSLGLNYSSGSGNGPFGLGWNASPASITRKTDLQLPNYQDEGENADTFIFAGAEDLVPLLVKDGSGNWTVQRTTTGGVTSVSYRPRIEGGFSLIEKITEANDNVYWRVTTGANVASIFGKSTSARIADPADPSRIFKWLLEFSYDDKGNCYQYEYKQEDLNGVAPVVYEKNRLNGNATSANTYLKRIKYGNKSHFNISSLDLANWSAFLSKQVYLFEMVFDYGEHDAAKPTPDEAQTWACRQDPFSNYKSGFDIRTYRLCNRVLMFHLFAELGTTPCLVSSLDLTYTPAANFTFLSSATHKGYIRQSDGSYTQKSLPQVDYTYQAAGWDTTVQTPPKVSIENLPTGIDNNYQWLDLYNEGIAGIITEQAGAWYYKANGGDGNFDGLQLIATKPNAQGLNSGAVQFQDIEASGQQFLVSRDLNGYYELSDDQEWLPFRNFSQVPNIKPQDKNVKLMDLNGDGRADLLLEDEQVFMWFASKGIEGYDTYRTTRKSFDEEKGPVTLFDDATKTIVLADMSGDGLTDIVRIRNGEVVYWPNLGYGRFGAKVTMANSPVFDTPDNFNPQYIKLADIDGSGTTSIVYFGHNTFKVYFNCAGNSWSQQGPAGSINPIPFPKMDEHATVSVIDLLGNGTACIVWSSPLPQYSNAPLQYIDLMGGNKPYILTSVANNMGAETHFQYKPSTYFYLQDKKAGTPWVTRLPFPVQCVSQVEAVDLIAKTRFTSQYTYHHGYYDHAEREFRGFGRVDQTDTEDFDNYKKNALPGGQIQIVDEGFHQPPVLSKTWFHTGAFLDKETILDQFAHEYYQNVSVPEKQPVDPPLPAGLTTDEWREALRACKGILLRSEVYTLDGSDKQNVPYATNNASCLIQQVQPKQDNLYSVWQVQQSEGLQYIYDRNPTDPRIVHSMTLQTDMYGNVLLSATISYGRKTTDPDLAPAEQAEQGKTHVVISQTSYTNSIIIAGTYRLPLSCGNSSWELTGTTPAAGDYYSLAEMMADFTSAAVIAYEVLPTTGKTEKRMLSQTSTLFLKNDLSGPLGTGVIESLALSYQSYKLALTPGLRDNIFGGKVTDAMLLNEGKYVNLNDGNYWIAGGTQTLDPANFYQATVVTDPFGFSTKVTYDSNYRLFVQQVIDAINNTSSVQGFNYRTLSPYLLQDINDNRSGVRADELGLVVTTFAMGKATEQKGDSMDTTSVEISAKDKPGTVLEYDLFNYQNAGKPNFTKTTVFDTHFYDLKAGQVPVAYVSYAYASGSGAVLMQKVQAEPGIALQENEDGTVTSVDTTPNLRWIGNGRTIINNKGNPVKQYEPYFSTTFDFEDSKLLVERGVTSIITYDSADRAVRTDQPNGTFSKVEFDAWKQLSYDPNDTVLDSQWYADRVTSPVTGVATPEEVAAANKAAVHANTPGISYLDSLGRTFIVVADNGTVGKLKTTTTLNITGQALSVINARGNVVNQSKYSIPGVSLYSKSSEAGERWTIMDVIGRGLRGFDSIGNVFRYSYDTLHRPIGIFIKPGAASEIKLESISYGEGLPNDKANNQRGKTYQHFNGGGISTNLIFDFKFNLLQSSVQLCNDYKNIIDWNGNPALDTQVFNSSSTFDAMNRALTATTPDKSIYMPLYNAAGVVNSVDMMLRGATSKTNFIKDINYDVKGRKESIIYGNNTKTNYKYDSLTERLAQVVTTGSNGTDLLQQLSYTYDPVGNITNVKDEAQQTVYFKNSVVSPSNSYTYDSIYRLINATGREHIGQNLPVAPNDPSRTSLPQPGDGTALRNYIQSYQYDAAGNILKMIHSAGAGSWTRTYNYEATSNRLTSETVGTTTQAYGYDAHGNINNIAQLQGLTWNLKDELQMADLGGGGKAYYVYASGQRSKKVIERSDGSKEIRCYLGVFELYKKVDSTGKVQEQTETLHVPGAAIIETKVIKAGVAAAEQLMRYQYSNHLGSVSLETDDKGVIISYEEYYPYGSTAYQAVNVSIIAAAKRYRYTGMEHDDETGMQYHAARYYLPWLGRWLSADQIGIQGGLNLYAYVDNDPVNNVDTSGHSTKEVIGKIVQGLLFLISINANDGSNGENGATAGGFEAPQQSVFTPSEEDEKKIDERNKEIREKGKDPKGPDPEPPKPRPEPEPKEIPERRLVTAQDLHENRNVGNAWRELKQTPPPPEDRLLTIQDLADIRANSRPKPKPGPPPPPPNNRGSAFTFEAEALEESAKTSKLASFVGDLIEGAVPSPIDAVQLTLQFAYTFKQVRDDAAQNGEAAGYRTGLAASLLGSPEEAYETLRQTRVAPTIGSELGGTTGTKEAAFNKGLDEGLRIGSILKTNNPNLVAALLSQRTTTGNGVEDIKQFAPTLKRYQEDAFGRREALKEKQAHQKWLDSVK